MTASPYTMCTGEEWTGIIFTCGELVFFKPAKTIPENAAGKVEATLIPGIFVDYFMCLES